MTAKSNLGLGNRVRVYSFDFWSLPVRFGWQLEGEANNIITNKGTDSVLKRLASPTATFVTGGGWIKEMGVGDGTDLPNVNDTDLKGVSKTYKTIPDDGYTYVRPILVMQVLFGKTEANHDWTEMVLKDNNGDTIARVLVTTLLMPKTNSKAALAEWQVQR